MFAPYFRRTVGVLFALVVSAANAAPPTTAPGPLSSAILFSRSQANPDSTLRNSALFVTDPSATSVRPLTPVLDGILDGAGGWSPNGDRVVFVRGRTAANPDSRNDVHVIAREGGRARRLSNGAGNFDAPAWGPRGAIAFVSHRRDRECVSVLDAGAHHPRDLFCPPAPIELKRPVWSGNGASLYVPAGHFLGQFDPTWRALAFRVDAATGSAVVLADGLLDEPLDLEIAPDGRRGIYSNLYASEMLMVDFATRQVRPIGWGYAPRWSKDGRRIAFTGEVFEGGPEFRYYEPLYVMNANGTGVRRITASRVDNHAYTAVDWSKDGRRVLLNRRIYLDPALTVRRMALRIVNVDTLAITSLTEGSAEPGAWFEP